MTEAATKLKDEHGEQGIYVVLSDLSIRAEGLFRLKLSLASILGAAGASSTQQVSVLAEEYTRPVCVYSSKAFPGTSTHAL